MDKILVCLRFLRFGFLIMLQTQNQLIVIDRAILLGHLNRVDFNKKRSRIFKMPTNPNKHDNQNEPNDKIEHKSRANNIIKRPNAPRFSIAFVLESARIISKHL